MMIRLLQLEIRIEINLIHFGPVLLWTSIGLLHKLPFLGFPRKAMHYVGSTHCRSVSDVNS
jgi:hypothetical protein